MHISADRNQPLSFVCDLSDGPGVEPGTAITEQLNVLHAGLKHTREILSTVASNKTATQQAADAEVPTDYEGLKKWVEGRPGGV
eukprot:SAG31_NODE_571_length_13998_cov_4.346212_9_plen_84_part_00